jgi:two-component sensor histidine kinase/HAMP domain-containing protein
LKKIFNFSYYSFSTKIILSLLLFVIIFKFIKITLTTPKIESNSLNKEIEYITRALLITKEEIKVIGKSLKMQTQLEIKLSKSTIEKEIQNLDFQTNNLSSKKDLVHLLENSLIPQFCTYSLSLDKKNISNKWEKTKQNFLYIHKLKKSNYSIELICSKNSLNPNHISFELDLKKHLKTKLLIDSELKDTKMAIFWINPNTLKDENIILLEENKDLRKEKYHISMLSNVKNIPTGDLTLKEILNSKNNNKPINHKIDNKEVLTWILDLSQTPSMNMFFVYSINKEQLENRNNFSNIFLLETLIAIGISFILILFIFKRLLKNINTLTKTAMRINQGEKNIRSHVEGEDDVGILGKSFDSMLDYFEENIENLDKKVKEKTKEISKSLEEKEILLKEIHHRVKNNLALTISLIELQEEEVKDKKTKKVLIDIQERIYTMELLHRKLYESTNLNKISLKSYITDLVHVIAKTYNKLGNLNINIQIDDIDFNIETAMPYGLIINELVTNSFKYAFVNRKNPTLEIKIAKQKNNEILLIIKDNGKGLDKDFSKISNETLGLRLINMIVKFQLLGTINYENNNGARFVILGKIKE